MSRTTRLAGTHPASEPVAKSRKTKTYLIAATLVVLGTIVGVALIVHPSMNSPNKSAPVLVTSALVTVHCTNCSYDSNQFHSQFTGSLNDGTGIRSVDGNEGDHYNLTRTDTNKAWFISWNLQMNSGTGVLKVVVTLNTGQTVFDQSTSVPYHGVAGSWST